MTSRAGRLNMKGGLLVDIWISFSYKDSFFIEKERKTGEHIKTRKSKNGFYFSVVIFQHCL